MSENAKKLIREADDIGPQPGGPPPPRRMPTPRRPGIPPSRIGADDDFVRRMTGSAGPTGPEGKPGQFTPEEVSQLKDVLILILATILHSDMDRQIGEALMKGETLQPNQLQHIVDEARQANIPESHGAIMQKIFSQL